MLYLLSFTAELYELMIAMYLFIILKLVFVLVIPSSRADGICRDGWTHHESSCYHFSHDTEPMLLASISCQHMGGDLVEIETAAENDFLFAKVKVLNANFWIGLSDIQEETVWLWYGSNRHLTSTGYQNWYPGEPNNNKGEENCVNIAPDTGGQWNDIPCFSQRKYICEKKDESSEIVG
ncbi:lactose-binding lectin l-2-like [Ruditapes philippinarum]|uniref:lactose-binding lectin l-2-like n=1 Tax=Ruditapes philippinarum TaxID=129788 RepID=UPI00295AADCE|nr:lactose-binding lectin l-2-like [Ruditapes philippinarum]